MNLFARLFDHSPKIETQRLILRYMRYTDAKDMYEYACDPAVTKYLLWAPHDDIDYTRRYLKQVQSLYREGEFHDFGIELKENGKFIGTCGFANLDMPNFKGEIGYVLNPAYWGRGIAAEAADAVMAMGFEKMGLLRIEARYMVDNHSSRRVMEKCGMTFEGVMRQSLFVKDGLCDIGLCSILKNEYTYIPQKQKFTNI